MPLKLINIIPSSIGIKKHNYNMKYFHYDQILIRT